MSTLQLDPTLSDGIKIAPFKGRTYALYRDGRLYAIGPVCKLAWLARSLRSRATPKETQDATTCSCP